MAFPRKDRFSPNLISIAAIAQCLSHPARLQIIDYLHKHGITKFSEIARVIPLSRQTINHHLSFLRASGLIEVNEVVPTTYYYINLEECDLGFNLLNAYLDQQAGLAVRRLSKHET